MRLLRSIFPITLLLAATSCAKEADPDTLVGKWIATENYETTIEFFSDGTSQMEHGITGAWSTLPDGRVKIIATTIMGRVTVTLDASELEEGFIRYGGSEYIPYDANLTASYAALAEALEKRVEAARSLKTAKRRVRVLRVVKKARDDRILKQSLEEASLRLGACRNAATRAIEFSPEFGRAYIIRAKCEELALVLADLEYADRGKVGEDWNPRKREDSEEIFARMLADKEKAIALGLTKNWKAYTLNDLAWEYATVQAKAVKDSEKGVEYAKKVVELYPDEAGYRDTLAAAYARIGDFDAAIETQSEAISMLKPEDEAIRSEFEQRLALYESHTPYAAQSAYGSQARPRHPRFFVDKDSCPDCISGKSWRAKYDIEARKYSTNWSPAAFAISEGEELPILGGVVVTEEPGVFMTNESYFKARKYDSPEGDPVPIDRGEVVFLYTVLADGVYRAWYRGEIISLYLPYASVVRHPSNVQMLQVKKGSETAWVMGSLSVGP